MQRPMPTEGPWKLNRTPTYWGLHSPLTGKLLATVPHSKSANSDANARLLAAATDLFDVVQALVFAQQQGMDPVMITAEDSPLLDAARDALRKVAVGAA